MAPPRSTGWDLPFWICLAAWGLVPATWVPWFDVGYVRCNVKDVALLAVSVYYAFVCRPLRSNLARGGGWLPHCFFLLGAYALVSMSWAGMPADDAWSMGYALLMTLAACNLAYRLVLPRTPDELEKFLAHMVLLLTAFSGLYFAESYFQIGLRSEEGLAFDYNFNDFGIERLRGPLFGAATGHFILLPALGFAVDRLVAQKDRVAILWGAISFVLLLSILALGSRAALVCLAAFVVLGALGTRRLGRLTLTVALLVALLVPGGWLLLQRATPTRFQDLQDEVREETYRTAWERIKDEGPRIALGTGYGSVWPWYPVDVSSNGHDLDLERVAYTEHGWMLYHPHSMLLLLVVELGAVGALFLLGLVGTLGANILWARRNMTCSAFAAGNAAVAIGFLVDGVLFTKCWQTAVVWWIGLLACTLLVRRNSLSGPEATR